MRLVVIDDGKENVELLLVGELSFKEYMDKLLHSDDVEMVHIKESVKC